MGGIGINEAFGAGLVIFQEKMEPNNFMKALICLSVTIWGTNWTFVWPLLPWLVVLIPLAIYKSKVLDVLRWGDSIAIVVGVQIKWNAGFYC
ncbi:iron chelate uptake ABC transporter family permease subunit [Peribacillus sp. NPDC058075]|uniref:iron chelate uptake ABC transporter family permease subunit n=1 Tax=unclassified Peribacillus TaxID=2675266 RepID=UPI0036D778E8